MPDVDMSNSNTIKISGVAYTKEEARILVAIVNNWLNENAAQPSVQTDSAMPSAKDTQKAIEELREARVIVGNPPSR